MGIVRIHLALLVAMTACDIFAPNGPRSVTIDLPFCGQSTTPLTWAAVKHAGAGWTYLTPSDGTVRLPPIRATATLTVAYGNSTQTRAYSASADELSQVSCISRRTGETKFLHGSVRDVPADEQFYVSVGSSSISETPFTFFGPEGPLTVVARTAKMNTGAPQRIIVRHGVDLPNAAEIPILDFSSNESRAFESATVTLTSSFDVAVANVFRPQSPASSSHELFFRLVGPGPISHFAVPASLLGPEDYHTFEVHDFSSNSVQELVYYYRRARDTKLAVGPPASMPTGSILSATPCARLQARVRAQPEYPSFVIVYFQADNTVVEVGVTKDYLGQTPSTWTVEIPNLASPDGSCLLPANPGSWSIMVTPQEGRIALHLGGNGRDGEMRRWSAAFFAP